MSRVLRPGDLQRFNINEEPERRNYVAPEARVPQLTQEWIQAYDVLPFSETKRLYETDPKFRALADELYDKRHPKGDQQ
jgi:hypothetical protein